MASDLHPEDRNAWLLLIGRRLRAEYDVVSEPVPPRLAALIEKLEGSADDGGNTGGQGNGNPDNGHHQDGGHDRSQDEGSSTRKLESAPYRLRWA
jgi:hypothetical protein